jgi:glutamate racemase
VGILGTAGTINSNSYVLEIEKFYPALKVYQQACPMWVPLVENNEYDNHGTDFFVKKYIHKLLGQDEAIDTILLACTHYPLLMDKIKEYSPADMRILSQGEIVAKSLADYLQRHPEIESQCSQHSCREFYTTDSTEDFDSHASIFYGEKVQSKHLDLDHG